jgi:hypothetical protein
VDAELTTMDEPMISRYQTLYCVVKSQQVYGLVVETETGRPGYIDSEFIADTPAHRDQWPTVAARLRVMVLGVTGDGRLVLSARESDLVLADSLVDPDAARQDWRAVKESGADAATARARFYQSVDAVALLRWATARLPSSADRQLAQALLAHAPETIRRELGLD